MHNQKGGCDCDSCFPRCKCEWQEEDETQNATILRTISFWYTAWFVPSANPTGESWLVASNVFPIPKILKQSPIQPWLWKLLLSVIPKPRHYLITLGEVSTPKPGWCAFTFPLTPTGAGNPNPKRAFWFFLETNQQGSLHMATGQKPVPPENIPIPTKIGSKIATKTASTPTRNSLHKDTYCTTWYRGWLNPYTGPHPSEIPETPRARPW